MTASGTDASLSQGRRLQAQLALRSYAGEAFERFFGDIMVLRDPDFRRVRPWGNSGDRKNDGWSPTLRMLFQAYAPTSYSSRQLVAKIRGDYDGAIDYWEQYFDTWVFVHNDFGGLGPEAEREIAVVDGQSDDVSCESWGPDQILRQIGMLTDGQLIEVFGPPITRESFLDVSAESLRPLFDHLRLDAPPLHEQAIPRVPVDKIERNGLSEHSKQLLLLGETKLPLVSEFVERTSSDPTYSSALAETFTERYNVVRALADDSDEVLSELVAWLTAGSTDSMVIVHAYTILAYFFFTCHIFEGQDG